MFRSATAKLTIVYSSILVLISIFFSANLYHLSYRELERGLRRQSQDLQRSPRLRNLLSTEPVSIDDRLREGRKQILFRLIYANVGIALIGGVGSYFLARRTLMPIEEAMERQHRFTANASHELRTPLAAMQSEIEVALRDKKLTKSQAIDQLKSNLEEVAKLEKITSGLLDLARNNVRNSREVFEVKHVLDEISRDMQKIARNKRIKIIIKSKKAKLHANKDAFRQLISILVENSVKYSPQGGEIEITTEQKRAFIDIAVKDHGQGIKKTDLNHIFDRFYRAEVSREKNRVGGYGLGLAIAKQIVDEANGKISVSSDPVKGTVFKVHLPTDLT